MGTLSDPAAFFGGVGNPNAPLLLLLDLGTIIILQFTHLALLLPYR